jgi:hypothetical protein
MECYDPHGDLINFYDEDHSQESPIWVKIKAYQVNTKLWSWKK